MRAVGKAVGWSIFEDEKRYYTRIEDVVAFLSSSNLAREVLMAVLRDSLEQDALDEDEIPE